MCRCGQGIVSGCRCGLCARHLPCRRDTKATLPSGSHKTVAWHCQKLGVRVGTMQPQRRISGVAHDTIYFCPQEQSEWTPQTPNSSSPEVLSKPLPLQHSSPPRPCIVLALPRCSLLRLERPPSLHRRATPGTTQTPLVTHATLLLKRGRRHPGAATKPVPCPEGLRW